MAEFISASEAARRYHVSEKTIRKWIKLGKLPATETHIEGLRQFSISTDDIEELLARRTTQRDKPEDTGISLAERMQLIEYRLSNAERRLDSLEAQRTPTSTPEPLVPLSPLALPRYEKPVRTASQSQGERANRGLPANLQSYTDFYRNHHISSGAADRARGKHFQVQAGAWHDPTTGHAITLALDTENQWAFCSYFKYHSTRTKLTECDNPDCMCHG